MIELMIAVVFLAVCASVIIEGSEFANVQSAAAFRRSVILSALQSQVEAVRGLAAQSLVTVTTTWPTLTVVGLASAVQMQTVVTAVSGSTNLYNVTTSATWTEPTYAGAGSASASLQTVVRQ